MRSKGRRIRRLRHESWGTRHTVVELDPRRSKPRGLRSLLRRHRHHLTPEQQARLRAYLAQLVTLGETLHAWATEIATLWRFPRNHAITEDKLTDFATSKTTV